MQFTLDFPAWTLVSWVLISALFIVIFRIRSSVWQRLSALERVSFGQPIADHPGWDYANYHRAASELILSAVTYPDDGRIRKLSEAEQYAFRAVELAGNEEQRRFTNQLIQAIGRIREEWQAAG